MSDNALSGIPATGFPRMGLQNPMAALSGFQNPADLSAGSFANPAPAGIPGIPGMSDMMSGMGNMFGQMLGSPMGLFMMGTSLLPTLFMCGTARSLMSQYKGEVPKPGYFTRAWKFFANGEDLHKVNTVSNNTVTNTRWDWRPVGSAGQACRWALRGLGVVGGIATVVDGWNREGITGTLETAAGGALTGLSLGGGAIALPAAVLAGGAKLGYEGYKEGSKTKASIGGALAGGGTVATGCAVAAATSTAAAGALAGSWFPIVGTIIGAVVGGAVGYWLGSKGAESKEAAQKAEVAKLKNDFKTKIVNSGIAKQLDEKIDKFNQLQSPGAENPPASNFAQDFAKEVEKLSPEEQVKAYTNAIAGLPNRIGQLDQAIQQLNLQQNVAAQMEEAQKMQKSLKRMLAGFGGGFGGFGGGVSGFPSPGIAA